MIPRQSITTPLNILIFGGTGDANRIASDLLQEFGSDVRLQLSLAGRTSAPRLPDGIPVRIGGFGGAEGIISWLGSEKTDLVIDATHPYATQISSHIAQACHAVATPCIQFQRPAWEKSDQDHWIMVKSFADSAKIAADTLKSVSENCNDRQNWFARQVDVGNCANRLARRMCRRNGGVFFPNH